MKDFLELLSTHKAALTIIGAIITAVLGFALYVGSLGTRVTQAEEILVDLRDTGEQRVVRIHNRIEEMSKELTEFTKEQQRHYKEDAETNKQVAVSLQKIASDIDAIRTQLDIRRSSRK